MLGNVRSRPFHDYDNCILKNKFHPLKDNTSHHNRAHGSMEGTMLLAQCHQNITLHVGMSPPLHLHSGMHGPAPSERPLGHRQRSRDTTSQFLLP